KQNGARRRQIASQLEHDAGTLAKTLTRELNEAPSETTPASAAPSSGLRRLPLYRQQNVRGSHHGRKALSPLARNPHRDMRATGLVQRLRQLLAQPPGADRVELDRNDREAPTAEAHRSRAGLPELDPCALQREKVLEGIGQRSEAVFQLLAQSLDVRHLER